jgi:hypothetical protein
MSYAFAKKSVDEEKKEKRRVLWTFHPLIHLTQPGEAVLPNDFLKWLQLHQKSRSTRGARAILGGAGALPNKPLIYMKNMNEIFVQNIVK